MCNRWVWLFTFIFWIAVIAFAGIKGVLIICAFSVCIMAVVLITERNVKHD